MISFDCVKIQTNCSVCYLSFFHQVDTVAMAEEEVKNFDIFYFIGAHFLTIFDFFLICRFRTWWLRWLRFRSLIGRFFFVYEINIRFKSKWSIEIRLWENAIVLIFMRLTNESNKNSASLFCTKHKSMNCHFNREFPK